MDSIKDSIRIKLLEAGYYARPKEVLAVRSLLGQRSGTRALLCEGPPGCGKTALGEALFTVLGAALVYYQCHAWTSDEDLFSGIHVPSAVAGDAESVEQPGVLRRVANMARDGETVVLIVDELDKAPERAEALLLDWLQTGRVPLRPGQHMATNMERVIVVVTSNGQRALGDAFLRRVRRLRMDPMGRGLLEEMTVKATGASMAVVTLAVKAGLDVARAEGSYWSLQESIRLVDELVGCCQSIDDCAAALAGWAAKTPDGVDAAHHCKFLPPIWGEIKGMRR